MEKATSFSLRPFHRERATPSERLAQIVRKEMNKTEVRLQLIHKVDKPIVPFPTTRLHPADPGSPTRPASHSTRYPAGFFHQIRSIPTRQHRHEQLQPINPIRDSTKLTHNPSSVRQSAWAPNQETPWVGARTKGALLASRKARAPGAKSGKHWDNNLTAAPPAQGRALHPLV